MKYLTPDFLTAVLFSILAGIAVAIALVCLIRLFCSVIFKQYKTKCPYKWIFGLLLALVFMLEAYPPNQDCIVPIIIFLLCWLFALLCAIIQTKVLSGLTWHAFGEDRMNIFFQGVQGLRNGLIKVGKMWAAIPAWGRIIIVALVSASLLISVFWCLALAGVLLIMYYLLILVVDLHSSFHSCRKLLLFWLLDGVVFSGCGVMALLNRLPNNVNNPPVAYCIFILLFTLFWIVSAGVADYEVAKMACSIVNTATTIILLAVNVLLTWCSQRLFTGRLPEETVDTILYTFNLIMLPLVASGYLAALFAEGQNYYWRRRSKEGDAKG